MFSFVPEVVVVLVPATCARVATVGTRDVVGIGKDTYVYEVVDASARLFLITGTRVHKAAPSGRSRRWLICAARGGILRPTARSVPPVRAGGVATELGGGLPSLIAITPGHALVEHVDVLGNREPYLTRPTPQRTL